MWSVSLLALFVFAPVAFAEIVYSEDCGGCGSPGGSTPNAFANGSSPFDESYGWGEMSYYTTVNLINGICYYEVTGWAEAHVRYADEEPCIAAAVGYADADGPDGPISVSVGACASAYPREDAYDPTVYDYGQANGYMLAWTSTSSSHSAQAVAVVGESSGQTAYAHGCVSAWCSLSGN
jgi:hypothetical protein